MGSAAVAAAVAAVAEVAVGTAVAAVFIIAVAPSFKPSGFTATTWAPALRPSLISVIPLSALEMPVLMGFLANLPLIISKA